MFVKSMNKPGLERLKSKLIGRRSSEPSVFDDNTSVELGTNIVPNRYSRVHSLDSTGRLDVDAFLISLTKNMRGRSMSLSKIASNKQNIDIIRKEKEAIVLQKVLNLLHELGLQKPQATTGSRNLKNANVSVSCSSSCIYLPPILASSFDYESADNSNETVLGEEDRNGSDGLNTGNSCGVRVTESNNRSFDTENEASVSSNLRNQLLPFRSPDYLCAHVDSQTLIPVTIAVIIQLDKPATIKDLKFVLQSVVTIKWPGSENHYKGHLTENFRIGHMDWDLNLSDCNYYVNLKNLDETKSKIAVQDMAANTRKYLLFNKKELDEFNAARKHLANVDIEQWDILRSKNSSSQSQSGNENNTVIYPEGVYLFLLPIIFPENIPATVNSVNGSLHHIINISYNKVSDKLNWKKKQECYYSIPLVRQPPLLANSNGNKSIYVNRIWNNSMNYVITFPRKYVALGSQHTINIKLIPLVKDVVLKGLKFNVLERTTYASRDLAKEFQYDDGDPFDDKRNPNKVRERVIPICELKTKDKSYNGRKQPYKEELIRCPRNNMLFSCYDFQEGEIEGLSLEDPLNKPRKNDVMIASPLDINVSLPFLTTREDKVHFSTDKNFNNNGSQRRGSINEGILPTSFFPSWAGSGWLKKGNNVEASTTILNENEDENINEGYTSSSRAIYPDSDFRHIRISHRLQICFRVSKSDSVIPEKFHHYEIVIDTPIVFLSAKCNTESIQLPRYNEDNVDILTSCKDEYEDINGFFRIPQFESANNDLSGARNGVSLNPLRKEADAPPSFEEAMSASPSPNIKPISFTDEPISKIPSVPRCIPGEPAPAYDFTERLEFEFGIRRTPNIDEVVDKGAESLIFSIRNSSVKSSLLHLLSASNSLQSIPPSHKLVASSDDLSPSRATLSSFGDCSGNGEKISHRDSVVSLHRKNSRVEEMGKIRKPSEQKRAYQ